MDDCKSCTKDAIFAAVGGIDPNAAERAASVFRSELSSSLSATTNAISNTAYTSVLIVAVNIYLPVLILIMVIIWLMVPAGVLTILSAIMLSIIVVIFTVIVGAILYFLLGDFLSNQSSIVSQQLSTFFTSVDYVNAIENAACAYVNALPTEQPNTDVNNSEQIGALEDILKINDDPIRKRSISKQSDSSTVDVY